MFTTDDLSAFLHFLKIHVVRVLARYCVLVLCVSRCVLCIEEGHSLPSLKPRVFHQTWCHDRIEFLSTCINSILSCEEDSCLI